MARQTQGMDTRAWATIFWSCLLLDTFPIVIAILNEPHPHLLLGLWYGSILLY
jgi:hypothetical protein